MTPEKDFTLVSKPLSPSVVSVIVVKRKVQSFVTTVSIAPVERIHLDQDINRNFKLFVILFISIYWSNFNVELIINKKNPIITIVYWIWLQLILTMTEPIILIKTPLLIEIEKIDSLCTFCFVNEGMKGALYWNFDFLQNNVFY